jgi:hypothetical protein
MTAECLPSPLTRRIERSGVMVKTVYSLEGTERSSTPKANGTLTFISRSLGVSWANNAAVVSNRQIVIRVRALFIEVSRFQVPVIPDDRSHFAAVRVPAQWSVSGLGLF